MVKKILDKNFDALGPQSRGKRVLSDIVIAPKKEITTQLFKEAPPTINRTPGARSRRKYKAVFLAVLAVLIVFLIFSTLYSSAEITVTPRQFDFSLNKTLALSLASGSNLLVFRTIAIPAPFEGQFTATAQNRDDVKAHGQVVIFNKAKDPQILIASTRLESSGGKIFRLPKTVVVPAAQTISGKSVPGSKEIAIIADSAGENYNVGLADFTFPGLKGSTKYGLVFARSKTEITGGSSGARTIVGKNDKDRAEAKLLEDAKANLANLVSRKLPGEELLLEPSLEYVIKKETVLPPVGGAANNFKLSLDGEVRSVSVNKADFMNALVGDRQEIANFKEAFEIANLNQLALKLLNYNFSASAFRIQVSGNAKVVYKMDTANMAETIKINKMYNAGAVLSAFPGLMRAEVRFKPFWLQFIGVNPRRVDIIWRGS